MAGASITITVDHAALTAAIKRLQQQSDDLSDVFIELGDYLTESTKQRFVDQQDPDGNSWDELTDTFTAAQAA